MKKVAIFIAAIGISIGIGLLFLTTPNRLFKIHILPQISGTIKDLKHYKDRCGMHGPFVFTFSASKEDVQNIITHNGLIKYEKSPEFVHRLLIHIDSHDLSWWEKTDILESMYIYGKEDKSSYEPHLKFIFVDNTNHVYYLQI